MAAMTRQTAILDREVAKMTQTGWLITWRTDTTAQLTRPRTGSRLGCLTGGIFYVLLRNKKAQMLYLSVDERGKVKRTHG